MTTLNLPQRDAEGRWPLEFARQVAEEIKVALSPACDRIEIAGSIRRLKPWVKDIELLCVPKIATGGNLEEVETGTNLLGFVLYGLLTDSYEYGVLTRSWFPPERRIFRKRPSSKGRFTYGPKNKFLVHVPTGINVDIFVTGKRNFGMAWMVRTGSKAFNINMMSRFRALGMAGHAYGGISTSDGAELDCPDEETVFKLLGWDWMRPEERNS